MRTKYALTGATLTQCGKKKNEKKPKKQAQRTKAINDDSKMSSFSAAETDSRRPLSCSYKERYSNSERKSEKPSGREKKRKRKKHKKRKKRNEDLSDKSTLSDPLMSSIALKSSDLRIEKPELDFKERFIVIDKRSTIRRKKKTEPKMIFVGDQDEIGDEPGKPKEEIKPKVIPRSSKEERIANGAEVRDVHDYPTLDEIESDWDTVTEKETAKDKKEEKTGKEAKEESKNSEKQASGSKNRQSRKKGKNKKTSKRSKRDSNRQKKD